VPQPWEFIRLIQGRENIQYGLSSAMVGAVFVDQRAEGISFVARNSGRPDTPWEDAVITKVAELYAETVVSATVELER
jgi:hypothetical protein